MSDLLSIGASGVRAYQTALTTVSENIANAGNAAFVKRTAVIGEVVAPGATSATGMGAIVAGISRSADLLRNDAVRSAGSDLARTQTGAVWLQGIQSALTGNGLSARITDFFTSAQGLAADPTSTAQRAVMLESASAVAASFKASGKALAGAAQDLDATAEQATATLDDLGASLAQINGSLAKTKPGTAAAAGLADQRDSILEQMSALVDVDAQFDSAGRATVKLGGAGGPTFVSGTDAGTLTYVRNDEGAVSFALHRAGQTSAVQPNGGALAGIADGAAKIAEATKSLNALATDFRTKVNQVQGQGRDANGEVGTAMFARGDSPTDLTVAIDDPAKIAAASAGEGTRGNGNLAALAGVRTSAEFETRLTGLVASNAATIQSREVVADAQGTIRDGAIAARDAVSGVNLDNEAVDLLRFQQAYQASSRVIQVARETFQSIIGIN